MLTERPLVAESGPSIRRLFGYLNDRFGEKRTFRLSLSKSGRRVPALPPEADIELNLPKRSANDPKATLVTGYRFANQLLYLGH